MSRRLHVGRTVAFLAGMGIFAGALWLLQREFRNYDLPAILAAVRAVPASRVALAVLCTGASYFALTFYDVLALRHVRRDLGRAKTMLTSFIAYVTSHNLGLSGIGGTAVRFRLYTAWGLSALEIGELVAFCGLTFWLGFLFLGGVVFVLVPLELPAGFQAALATTRPLGFVFLVATAAFLVWSLVLRKPVRVRAWTFAPPSARELLLQLPLATLDWTLSAAVLFALLPQGHGLAFATVLSVFLTAQVIGMISHVPAGLGVFEAVVLHLLPGRISTPELAGALLLYRAIYYLLPLLLGAVSFLGIEGALRRRQIVALQRWVLPLGEAIVPRVLAFTTSLAGGVLLLTGALPAEGQRLVWIRDFVPLPVLELSHFLGSLVGAALLLLGRGLVRRIDAAWWLCVALLVAGIVLALARGLDYEEACLLALMLLALLPYRRSFHRRASLLQLSLRPGWWQQVGVVVASSLWLGLLAYRHVEYSHDLWWQFGYEADAARFLRASAGLVALLGIFGVARLLAVAPARLPAPTSAELGQARAILAAEPETLGHLALLGDKQLLFDEAHTSFLMFAIQGRSWIAMGDPVGGSSDVRRDLVWRFRELAERAGGRAVFYQVGEETLSWYVEAGFSLLKIGEEGRVDLAAFSLQGGAHKGLRSAVHKLEREGLSFEVLPAERVPAELPGLRVVSDAWLRTKNTREKGFSLGSFRTDYLALGPMAVVRQGERTLAFANLWLGAPGGELSVDLMRHVADGPGGLMDFLFVRLLEWGRVSGYRWFSLGMAPLAGLEERSSAPVWNRIGGLVFRYGEHFYNFQGLRQYKAKFDPVWRTRYLAVPSGLTLPGVLADVSTKISGGVRATIAH